MRDDEIIATADELGLAMVFTGERHFLTSIRSLTRGPYHRPMAAVLLPGKPWPTPCSPTSRRGSRRCVARRAHARARRRSWSATTRPAPATSA